MMAFMHWLIVFIHDLMMYLGRAPRFDPVIISYNLQLILKRANFLDSRVSADLGELSRSSDTSIS